MCGRFASSNYGAGGWSECVNGGMDPSGAEVAGRIRDEVARRPDVTLDELGHWIADQAGVRLSRSLVWLTLTRLGLPMKKRRSTPSNAIPRSTSSGGAEYAPPG